MKIQLYDFFYSNGHSSVGENDIIIQFGTKNFPTNELDGYEDIVKKFAQQFLERYIVGYSSFPAGNEDESGNYKNSYFCLYLLDNRVSLEEKESFCRRVRDFDYGNGIVLN